MTHNAGFLELCYLSVIIYHIKRFQMWPHESNSFIKSIMTAGTNCTTRRYIFYGYFKHWARESDYRWTLPVKWDWLLISGGRSGGSDSVGTLSGSPPCRYMLCEEAAPLRSITHTSVWETDMKHVPLNVWRSHIKTWMLHLCVSCWPDSWAL